MSTQAWLPSQIESYGIKPCHFNNKERVKSTELLDRSLRFIGLPVFEQVGSLFQIDDAMLTSHTLDLLYENIVHWATEILQVDFSRLVLRESGGGFRCKASFHNSSQLEFSQPDYSESISAQKLYQKVLSEKKPVLLDAVGNNILDISKKSSGMAGNESLCLAPMIAGSKQIGVFIFGRRYNTPSDRFWEEKIKLACITANQAANAIHIAGLAHELEKSQLETVMALSKAIDARDHYTSLHGKKIVEYAVKLARKFQLSYDDIQTVRYAALLHDIGKIGVPDHILYKPGPLTLDEWVMMKQHPVIGADIVLSVTNLANVASIIRAHHERYDGGGYPDGLKGDEIPFCARILSVVDAYSVMLDHRRYQPALSPQEAMEEIKRCSGSQFDPLVVENFISVLKM